MARSSCEPCCNPTELARLESSFRDAALQILCEIASNTSGGGGVEANVNVAQWGGVVTSLGQKVMASSVPVVIASNQSAIDVNASGEYNLVPPVLADGASSPLQLDSSGNLRVYLTSLLFGENDTVDTTLGNVGTLGVTQNPAYSLQYSPLTDLQSAVISRTTANTANKNILVSYSVQNTSATMLYFQIWNGATVGAGTLVDFVPVPAGTTNSPGSASKGRDDFGSNGLFCATGISWGWSTTPTTYTAVGAGTGLTTQIVYFTA